MSDVRRGIRLEITGQLSSEAAETIAQWIGCFGVIWNCKVAENKHAYQAYLEQRKNDANSVRPKADQKAAHFQTEERPWLRLVPSQIRRNAAAKWREAMQAAYQGIRAFPAFRKAGDKKNCYVTSELFVVKQSHQELFIGLKRRPKQKPFCWLRFDRDKAELGPPNSLWLRRHGARFWVSWSYTVERELADAEQVLSEVASLSADQQHSAVVGIDMGVAVPVAISTGRAEGFQAPEARAMRRHEKRIRRLNKHTARQRRVAKRQRRKCGVNYRTANQALGDRHARKANLRKNAAHRISKELADQPKTRVIVAEALNIKGMVRKPRAKQDPETGGWQRNGARAKAGLNRAVHNIGWGSILDKLEYKLAERGKLLVRLDPKNSSRECERCGHTTAENRRTQARFVCVACGYTANADLNAARVLKGRFLRQLNAGTFAIKAKTAKKTAPRKSNREADRTAVSLCLAQHACGADISPPVNGGSGYEAGSRRGDPRQAGAGSGSSPL